MGAVADLKILDEFGRPIVRNGKKRIELVDAFVAAQNGQRANRRPPLDAKYDAVGSGKEYENIWEETDAFDADSANSRSVREKAVQRSRYETNNNGWTSGINRTYANDLVGLGPTLRMMTRSKGFNEMVESAWHFWAREIMFRRKLWCLAHAKDQDGEGFGVLRQNKSLRHKIKLDLVLHETEQCQTPLLPFQTSGYIDGIKFDEFSNPVWYDFLREHPGSTGNDLKFDQVPERVPAKFVLHWFKLIRPGQHRGMPESISTLNVGAAGRRWRESVLASADNIANYSLFIKTEFEPDELDEVKPMSTFDTQKRMMTALPRGYDAFQPDAKQPTATHETFSKSLINEQARPKSMPLNKAMCNSSDYNFASGRLDHSTYYGALDVDRIDCNELVLDPCFDVWFETAIVVFGWLGGNPDVVTDAAKAHTWDWPKHQVADIKSQAAANDTNLKNGSATLTNLSSEEGKDYEDELIKTAASHGVDVDTVRKVNYLVNQPQHVIPYVAQMLGLEPVQQGAPPNSNGESDDDEEET